MHRAIFVGFVALSCLATCAQAQGPKPSTMAHPMAPMESMKAMTAQKVEKKYDRSTVFYWQTLANKHDVMHITTPANCEDALNVDGQMDISGPAGSTARLELRCGGALIASCTETSPGFPMAKRCVIDKLSATRGKFTCNTVVLRGNPDFSSTCTDP